MADTRYAEQLLAVVTDATRTVNTRFVTFLTVGVYVAVTIASTTDEMLLKGSLVTLPLLNTQIPISGRFGFYTVAPWLLVGLHVDLLLQLSMLGAKLAQFNAELSQLDDTQREQFRHRMPSFYYVQFLAGETPSRFLHVISGLVICGSMIVLPLLLLSWTQVRFLALHDSEVTWSQRLAVIADVVMILAFLWRPLAAREAARRGRPDPGARARLRKLISLQVLVGTVCAVVLVLSIVAVIPGDQPGAGYWFSMRNLNLRGRVLTKEPLTPQAINALADGDVQRREQELAGVSRLNSLQGRDLRHANFFNAVLPRLDLRSEQTQLQGADLQWAQMQEVLLDDANLQDTKLRGAQLQGASLVRAKLHDADLSYAQLQDAKLGGATLQGATLRNAQLQGADLSAARAGAIDLTDAQLQGANLRGAQLQGANLSGASLQGADLSGAHLDGAQGRGANLKGALLTGTVLDGAKLTDANLELTGLDRSFGKTAGDASPAQLADYLGDLACGDAYVARGLAAQALSSGDAARRALTSVLLKRAESSADCRGVELLPANARAALERQAEAK